MSESGKQLGGMLEARRVFLRKTSNILAGLDPVAEFFLDREEDSASNMLNIYATVAISFGLAV